MSRSAIDRDTTFGLYCNLMAEIKTRNRNAGLLIDHVHKRNSALPDLDPEFVGEFCYLQLRKMCELVAVGCLIAHGDIEKTRTGKLQGTYHARTLLKALGALKPDFFPVPYDLTPAAPLEAQRAVTVTDGPLTKAELLHLYDNECGPLMHMGSAEELLSGKKLEIHMDRLVQWFTKFARLLVRHRIKLASGHEEVWVDMSFPGHEVRAMLMVPPDSTTAWQTQKFSTPEGLTLITASPGPIEF